MSQNDDEEDLFAPEQEEEQSSELGDTWEILVVDDEIDVHQMTRVVLDNFTFEDKGLNILSAHSAEEAKRMLAHHPEVALMLLDVVMETSDAGLKLVEYIREALQNRFLRIVLRTGQPGSAPEKEVIHNYDINDYVNKAELTGQRTSSIVTANLRNYSSMMAVESNRQYLEEEVAKRTRELTEKNAQLEILNQHLRQLDQERNEFLAIAAHDLKNPLSAIHSLAEMIVSSDNDVSRKEIMEMVKLILDSSKQTFHLVRNILEVNTIESGKFEVTLEPLDTLPLLNSLVDYYEGRARSKEMTLHFEYDSTHYYALADKESMRQVLENLISNAVKYSSPKKKIFVRLQHQGNRWRFEVRDEGPGLSERDKSNLFNKFARLSPKPTGNESSTGLGLFIVKKLAESMNGNVGCESQIGKGSTFFVEFPSITPVDF